MYCNTKLSESIRVCLPQTLIDWFRYFVRPIHVAFSAQTHAWHIVSGIASIWCTYDIEMRNIVLNHISSIGCCNPLGQTNAMLDLTTMLENGNFDFPCLFLLRFPLLPSFATILTPGIFTACTLCRDYLSPH